MQHFYDKYHSKISDCLQKYDNEFKDQLEEKARQMHQVSIKQVTNISHVCMEPL